MKDFYRNISRKLFGDKERVSLDARVLTVTTFYAGIISISFSVISLALSLDFAHVLLIPAGLLFLLFYALARNAPYFHERLSWLAVPCMTLMLAVLAYLWTVNAGSQGGSQYYFFLVASAITVLLRGWAKFAVSLVLIAVVAGLIYLEHIHPEWIVGYTSEQQRFEDVLISFVLALFFFSVVMASITRNYEASYRKVESFRLHFSEDLAIAKQLQKRLYHSEDFDDIKQRYDLALKHIPSRELSGDLYELGEITRDAGAVLRIFLADARGHGINASLSAMLIKSEWANLNHEEMSPAQALSQLNQKFFEHYGDSVSFSAVIADLYESQLVFASAGHDLQYLLGAGDVRELASSGPPIGIVEEPGYEERSCDIDANDRLLLFTDALCEELDVSGRPVGTRWFLTPEHTGRRPSALMADKLIQDFARLRGRDPDELENTDDLTMIVVGHP
ncbi:MAG: serine/threonine-protein phosphatase [bacterium]|nr:serine/threonine-protein phosphatase [bacterium]